MIQSPGGLIIIPSLSSRMAAGCGPQRRPACYVCHRNSCAGRHEGRFSLLSTTQLSPPNTAFGYYAGTSVCEGWETRLCPRGKSLPSVVADAIRISVQQVKAPSSQPKTALSAPGPPGWYQSAKTVDHLASEIPPVRGQLAADHLCHFVTEICRLITDHILPWFVSPSNVASARLSVFSTYFSSYQTRGISAIGSLAGLDSGHPGYIDKQQ